MKATEAAVKATPTPENYLTLSLAYYRAGRFSDTIAAAREALKLRPAYPGAWNNIAVSFTGLGMFDEAVQACGEALKLRPDFQLAKNNMAWAQSQRAQADKAKAQIPE